MRTPETPPDWLASLRGGESRDLAAVVQLLAQGEVERFVRSANDRYLHWDKLRFQPLPEGLSPVLAWAAVQLSRRPQQQRLPLRSYGEAQFKYWLPPQHQEWVSIIDQ